MSDFFFQIILAALSIVIGISAPLLTTEKQRKLAKWSAIGTLAIALVWAGYEWGAKGSPSSLPSEISTPTILSTESSPTDSQTQEIVGMWQLNPALPEPNDFIGWKSSQAPMNFETGTWTRNQQVTINDNQLVLIYGSIANLSPMGEIGTDTNCFLIASRGPSTFTVDLMSAQIEIYEVEQTANSLVWAAQKAKVLAGIYPSTCGKGVDVVVGK